MSDNSNLYGPDIYTEAEGNEDTLANLGPLRPLAGIWEGTIGANQHPIGPGSDIKGQVIDGNEHSVFVERYELQPIDPQTNGPQLFYGLRYHVHINTAEEDITFHDQVGYWLWEPATGLVLQTLAIPRGQVALSSGHAAADAAGLTIRAERGQTEYGICSTAFLEYAFRTESFTLEITFNADGSWSYVSDTMLAVRGAAEPFLHRDVNTLTKVGEPTPNPLFLITQSRQA